MTAHEPTGELSVRRGVVGDEGPLRSVRLRAMLQAPEAFGSTFEREAGRTVAEWASWLAPGAVFLLESSTIGHPAVGQVGDVASSGVVAGDVAGDVVGDTAGGVVGLAAGYHDHDEPGCVTLAAVWIEPAFRGRGGIDALIAEFLRWAAGQAPSAVRLWVAAGNLGARRAYERAGFASTGETVVRARDGVIELEMRFPLHRLTVEQRLVGSRSTVVEPTGSVAGTLGSASADGD